MLNNLRAIYQVMRDAAKPRSEIEKIVHERLRGVLISAYQTVPYYREIMQNKKYDPVKDYSGPSDLSILPITTKKDIKKRDSTSFVREGSDLSCQFNESTSGSSGMPLRIYRTSDEQSIHIAKWLRVLLSNGYSLHHKVMAPVAPEKAKYGRSVLQKIGLLRRMAVDYVRYSTEEMVDIFLAYQPDVLYGNRCHLDLMALELKRRQINPKSFNLKLLVAAAEIIHQSNRQLYKKYFGSDVIENYGSVEMGVMAYETPARDGLHLCDDLIYFEFLNRNDRPVFPGEPGRVVVTDLTGTFMPFIRYDQGDMATFEYRNDSDGEPVRRLTQIIGRDNDYAILPDGEQIPVYTFAKLIGRHYNIMQYRFIQQTKTHFKVLIAADALYFPEIQKKLSYDLKEYFSQRLSFDIVQVERIDPDPNGKIRTLISELDGFSEV